MNKKIKIILLGILFVALFIAAKNSTKDFFNKIQSLSQIIQLVENYYVEEVDMDNLIDGSIRGLLETLDPHSQYITAEEFDKINETMKGEFEGIGIEFSILDGYITVISPIAGTPSDKAGLLSGDQIIKINGGSAYKIKQADIIKKLRGPKGTPVVVTIKRLGVESFDVTLVRDKIPINSVMASFLYNQNTGYINANRFGEKTFYEISSAIDSLENIGMEQLILDLRNNGGGLMDQALNLLDIFIHSNDTLLYTVGRIRNANNVYYATKSQSDKTFPIIILINRASASASEIIAGGLQDLDRGLIIGETSFGKGLVQRQYGLEDGSAARITIAKYYTPSGRLIQRPFKELDEYYLNLNKNNRENIDSLNYQRPVYETKGGRLVYGGGGITPDIYIDNELRLTKSSQNLIYGAQRFIFKYANSIKKKFQKYHDINELSKHFAKNTFESSNFLLWLDKRITANDEYSFEYQKDSLLLNWDFINNRIQSEVAANLLGKDYLYFIRLKMDKQFLLALDSFEEAQSLIK